MNCVFRDQHIIATQDLACAGVSKVSARVASAAIPFGETPYAYQGRVMATSDRITQVHKGRSN
jgi:hypothetical protein